VLVVSHGLEGARLWRGWKPPWTNERAFAPVTLCRLPKRFSNPLQDCGFEKGIPFPTPLLLHGDKVYSVNACLAFESLTQAVLNVI